MMAMQDQSPDLYRRLWNSGEPDRFGGMEYSVKSDLPYIMMGDPNSLPIRFGAL